MTTSIPLAPIRGRRVRYTRLDACGVPVIGPATTHVSKGFVSVELTPNYDDGEDIQIKNAYGEIEINEPADAQLVNLDAKITFTKVDPDLLSMITGQPTVLDVNAAAVGFRMRKGMLILGGWALEIWSNLGGQCLPGGELEYGYSLLPFLRGGKLDSWTVENGAASFAVTSTTRDGTGWGVGPYDVVLNPPAVEGDDPVPGKLLEPLTVDDHFYMQATPVAPPAPADGLTALAA